MTRFLGQDGRLLVDTKMAAYSLGMKPSSFRTWAGRRTVTPAAYRPNPWGGQATALWDLADIIEAPVKRHNAA